MKHAITFIFLFISLQCLFAQGLDLPDRNIWPETPQAATLREVTMPPPALSTGAVAFSIPLHTIETDGLDLNLELRYSSNGIRVNDDPYPIGYGWTLLPAFKVTRAVLGRPDGEGFEFIGERSASSLTHPEKQRCVVDSYRPHSSPLYDSEHDIFTVHLPDISFNAWLENDSLVTVGHDEYLLQTDSCLNTITVIDPFGRIWDFSTIGSKWMTHSPMEWALTSVTSPNGKIIEFNWTFGYHGVPNGGGGYKWDYYYPLLTGGYMPDSSWNGEHNVDPGIPSESLNLSSIKYPGGEVIFTYNGSSVSPTTLKELLVKAGDEAIKEITFKHGTTPSEMTMLNEIHLPDESKYTFSYNSTRFTGYDSQDYWGYYNRGQGGQTGPGLTIRNPAGNANIIISGSDRSPDEEMMKARILTKIKYPTGGSVEWEYEAHRFDALNFADSPDILQPADASLSFGGGLRVSKEILRECDSDSNPLTVEFVYGKDGNGKAVVEQYPTASTFLSNTLLLASTEECTECGYSGIAKCGMISASPGSSCLAYRFGDPMIWYEEVQEIYPEGRVAHHFYKDDTGEYNLSWLNGMKPVALPNVFSSGILENLTETYGIRDEEETLLEKRETEYMVSGIRRQFQGIIIDRIMCQNGDGNISPDFPEGYFILAPGRYEYGDDDIYQAFPYTVIPNKLAPEIVRHTEYTENGEIVTTEEYTYVEGTGLSQSVSVTRGGKTAKTEYLYSDHFSTTVADAMADAHIIGMPLGVRQTYGSAVSEEYFAMGRIGTGNLFRPITYRKSRGGAAPHIVSTYSWTTGGSLASAHDVDGVKTEYTWDPTGMYPQTMKVGGKLSTVATWKPFVGVDSLRDPSGVTEAYTYDSGFRLASVSREGRLTDSFTYSVKDDCTSNVISREWFSSSKSFDIRSEVDGLGRVAREFTPYPEGTAAVLNEFDDMGRLYRKWNAAPATVGSTEASIKSSATTFYSDSRPFVETRYEASTRKLPLAEMQAGERWHEAGKMVEYRHLANGIPEYSLLHVEPSSSGVTVKGMYPRGDLRIDINTDEDGREHTVYTDARGLKVYESHGGPGTYYVYDDYGDLRYILPPGASPEDQRTSDRMRNLCYWYDYDSRGNLVTRKLPGVREERYLYDPSDRLVAEKGRDLPEGVWRLHIYDGCARQVLTVDARITDIQASSFAGSCRKASLSGTSKFAGYSVTPVVGVPSVNSCEVREALYYDDYTFLSRLGLGDELQFKEPVSDLGIGPRIDPSARGSLVKGDAMGRLTGRYTGEGYESYYYDVMGMELQRCATGYDRGRTTSVYTYNLKPLSVHRTYDGVLPDLDTYYSYDSAGRTKAISHVQHRVVNGLEVCDTASSVLSYDKVGRIIAEQTGKVTRERTYDVRSWLRNSKAKLPSGSVIFSEKIKYEDGVLPQYSGRVSGYEWSRGTTGSVQKYDFTYNARGNLIKAAYGGVGGNADFSTEYTYGLRGELQRLKRKGVIDLHPSGHRTYGLLDDVTAEYEGNRPVGLTVESDAQVFSSRTGMRSTGEFALAYDDSGRLVSDSSRGITSIEYDNSGLPESILFTSGAECSRVHDSGGNLLNKTLTSLTSSGLPVTTEYTFTGGGHVLRNDTLEMTRFPGGYFSGDGEVYYYVRDYRGNNVAVVRSAGSASQIMDYYPYGEPFSEWNWEAAANVAGMSSNRYLFCGNERETAFGMNQYDFNARTYLASFPTFTQIDPQCEKYPWLSPYAYCGGDPINHTDPTGEIIDTVWDVLNVLYDAGMSIYAVSTGDKDGARAYLVDLGCDTFAMIIPGLPAGASKLGKAGAKGFAKQGSKQAAKEVAEQGTKKIADKSKGSILDHMGKGNAYNREVKEKAMAEGRNVVSEKRLVPMNGEGNIKGNRTTVDLLERLSNDEYVIYENKLNNLLDYTKGQKAAKNYVEACNANKVPAFFEVRSRIPEFGLKSGDQIQVIDYIRNNKEILKRR